MAYLLIVCVHAQSLTGPTLCNPMNCNLQASLSMGFSRQEYWSGLPFPPPGDLPDPGIKPVSPALAGGFLTTEPLGDPTPSLFYMVNPCLSIPYIVVYVCYSHTPSFSLPPLPPLVTVSLFSVSMSLFLLHK